MLLDPITMSIKLSLVIAFYTGLTPEKWYLTSLAYFSIKQLVLCKVYIDEGGIKQLHHALSTHAGDYPLAKVRGLSPRPVLLRNPIFCDFS